MNMPACESNVVNCSSQHSDSSAAQGERSVRSSAGSDVSTDPDAQTKYDTEYHPIEEQIAHAFHYASISILGVLLLETILKIFFEGRHFLKKKFEMWDAFVVTASFIVDLVFLKGITTLPIRESVYILSFVLPWRVIRVVNSLLVAVLEHEHFKIMLLYASKRRMEDDMAETKADIALVRKQLHVIKRMCVEAGVHEWMVNQTLLKISMQGGVKDRHALASLAAMSAGTFVDEKHWFKLKFHKTGKENRIPPTTGSNVLEEKGYTENAYDLLESRTSTTSSSAELVSDDEASENSASRVNEEIETRVNEETKTRVNEGTKKGVNEETKTRANEETKTRVNEGTKTRVNEETKTRVNEETKTRANEETKTRANEETKTRVNEGTKTRVNEETKTRVHVGAKTRVNEETTTTVQEGTKTRVNVGAKTRVNEETKTSVNEETKTRVHVEAKTRVNEETKTSVNEETKTRANEETKTRVNEETKTRVHEGTKTRVNEETKTSVNDETKTRIDEGAKIRVKKEPKTRVNAVNRPTVKNSKTSPSEILIPFHETSDETLPGFDGSTETRANHLSSTRVMKDTSNQNGKNILVRSAEQIIVDKMNENIASEVNRAVKMDKPHQSIIFSGVLLVNSDDSNDPRTSSLNEDICTGTGDLACPGESDINHLEMIKDAQGYNSAEGSGLKIESTHL